MPKLEVELEKEKKDLASLVMERATKVADVVKMKKLENDLAKIGKAMAQLQSAHDEYLNYVFLHSYLEPFLSTYH